MSYVRLTLRRCLTTLTDTKAQSQTKAVYRATRLARVNAHVSDYHGSTVLSVVDRAKTKDQKRKKSMTTRSY